MDAKPDLDQIKEKLLKQIEEQYPADKAQNFKDKINGMEEQEFLGFLSQQGLIPGEGGETSQCIFCSLASGAMPRTDFLENEDAIAILELNPASRGHSLIIPKKHIASTETMPEDARELAKKASEELMRTFKPTKIEMIPGNVMGHEIINVLPIYTNETLDGERQQETPEGLAKLKEEITNSKPTVIEEKAAPTIIEETIPEQKEEINETNTWLPKRFP